MAAALARTGGRVYAPLFGGDSRVDLIFEDGAGLDRVQCKTSRVVGAALVFQTCSNTNQVRRDYRGEIDVFGVYSPELEQVFLVPVGHVPSRGCSLRLDAPRNGQQRNIRWAHDYVVDQDLPQEGVVGQVPSIRQAPERSG